MLLIVAVVLAVRGTETANGQALLGACTRVGIVCGVLWIAWPELARLPGWIFAAIPVAAVLVAYKPRYFLVLVPLLLLMMIVNPNRKKTRG